MNFKKTVAIVAAAGALTALALPALAENTFYGSARLATFFKADDKPSGTADPTNFDEHLQANSRFGMNATNGNMTGKVELGINTSTVTTRLLYGSYNFGFAKVLVGQDYNNYYFISNQVAGDDNVNNNYGSLWDGRQAQIKVTLPVGLYVAAIQPTATAGTTTTTKILMPKLNVGYEGKFGPIGFGTGVVGQTYRETFNPATTESITSLLGYFHGTLGMGPAELKFNLGYGQNTGNMNFTTAGAAGVNKAVFVAAAGPNAARIEDTNSFEGYVQAKFTASPTLALNVGVGYAMDKNDTFTRDDTRLLAFVNAPIVLAKGFTVVPEVTYIDQLDEKAGTAKGDKVYYAGAKWQMDF